MRLKNTTEILMEKGKEEGRSSIISQEETQQINGRWIEGSENAKRVSMNKKQDSYQRWYYPMIYHQIIQIKPTIF